MSQKIRPLGRRIVVEKAGSLAIAGRDVITEERGEAKLSSGLWVPTTALPEPQEVRVLAVGPKVKKCSAGDKVFIQRGCLQKVTEEHGQQISHILVDEDDILARVSA